MANVSWGGALGATRHTQAPPTHLVTAAGSSGAGRGCQHIEVTIFLFPLPTDQLQLRCSSPSAACQPWHHARNCQVVIPASTQINHSEHLALGFMMPQWWSVKTVTVNIFGATFSSHSTLPPYISKCHFFQ